MFLAALRTLWGVSKGLYGLLPPKVWAALAVLAAVLLYHAYAVHKAHSAGYTEGFTEANEQCSEREAKAQEEHDRQLKALDEKYRGIEEHEATQLAAVGDNYAKQLQALEQQRRRDVDRARSGALVVRVPGACPARDRSPAEGAAPAARSDGAQGCQLSAAAGGNLLDLISDADRNTRQLTACQAVIHTYQEGQS